MAHNGQRVYFLPGMFGVGRIVFSGLCPFCAGAEDGCKTRNCYAGEMTVDDQDDTVDFTLRDAFVLNLKYVNFDTAYRLGKELATAARLKLEAQGVTGWEVGQ